MFSLKNLARKGLRDLLKLVIPVQEAYHACSVKPFIDTWNVLLKSTHFDILFF